MGGGNVLTRVIWVYTFKNLVICTMKICTFYVMQIKLQIFKIFYVCLNIVALKCLLVSAAAAKSLQSCLTLCDPIDGSPPGTTYSYGHLWAQGYGQAHPALTMSL